MSKIIYIKFASEWSFFKMAAPGRLSPRIMRVLGKALAA